jgi:hypothetical protein
MERENFEGKKVSRIERDYTTTDGGKGNGSRVSFASSSSSFLTFHFNVPSSFLLFCKELESD